MSEGFALRLFLVRHGKIVKNQGHLPDYDAPLQDSQPELAALAPMLKEAAHQGADWHVSPLLRARQSFDIIAPNAAEMLIDHRLEEQNFGTWHGKPTDKVWQEINKIQAVNHPVCFVNHDIMPPDGTSYDEIYQKAGDVLSDILNRRPIVPQIIISHAGMTSALLGQMMGLSAPQAMMLTVAHGSISCADYIWQNEMPEEIIPWQIHYINRLYSEIT